ncbi:hypothetical protein GCM10023198_58200 [Promicromonospora umidemergens]|uniref:Uncharacterized protein n=1 Tax=Promicromonospora umidemergens TaxID=629679 RepID=A0ABP8YDN1_9MICO
MWNTALLRRPGSGAAPDCRVDELRDVPVRAWPTLVRERRAPASFENVSAHVEREGEADENLASLLASVDATTSFPAGETARQELATALINTDDALLDVGRPQRTRLAGTGSWGSSPSR